MANQSTASAEFQRPMKSGRESRQAVDGSTLATSDGRAVGDSRNFDLVILAVGVGLPLTSLTGSLALYSQGSGSAGDKPNSVGRESTRRIPQNSFVRSGPSCGRVLRTLVTAL